jgi:putative MATE family efflux protein
MDLTVGKESKLILKFATPMLLGNVFQQLYAIVDSVIVGNLIGKEALAAVGQSFPIIFVLISLVIGAASGGTIIISQYFGAKDMKKVQKSIDTLYVFLFFASILTSAVGLIFSDDIFRLIEVPDDILPFAKEYITIYVSGIVLFFGFNGTSAILRGLGDSKTPLYFMIISTIFNIVLDYVFIKYFGWGIAGAAYATIVAQFGAFVTAIIYLNRNHDIINLSFRKLDFDWDIFKKSVKIGTPSGFQQSFVALGMIALLRIVNEFGTDVAAAYSVVGRIDALAAMPAMNFAAALSTFVGQNIGANKIERVRKGYITTMIMTSVIALSVTVLVIFTGKSLMSIFTDDPEVIRIGAEYLVIVSSFYVVFSMLFTNNAVMRGAGDTLIPMFITLIALWFVRVPASWYLSRGSLQEIGIWWGVPTGWIVGALFSFIYYMTGKWKSKSVVKYPKK